MKRLNRILLGSLLIALSIAAFSPLAWAAVIRGRIRMEPNLGGLTIGGGHALKLLYAGQADVDNGQSAETVTLSGVLPGDLAVASYNETPNSTTWLKAVCTTDTLTLTLSGAAGTTTTLNYIVIGK